MNFEDGDVAALFDWAQQNTITKEAPLKMKTDDVSHFEYFKAQNTGWSGGISWFDNPNSQRYVRFSDALADAKAMKNLHRTDTQMKHRVVKVEVTETSFKI
jgi:hypothetical protein